MSRFQSNIQPSVVKLAYIPESYLDGKYYINYNCINIECLSSYTYMGDLPRMYFDITDAVVSDDTRVESFIRECIDDPQKIIYGSDGMELGIDYFINDTLSAYFGIIPGSYPNYLSPDGEISSYFEACPRPDWGNLKYYNRQNRYINYQFSEDEIRDFYATFSYVILEGTVIDSETVMLLNNQIYTRCLNYYAKHRKDETAVGIELILGTKYNVTPVSVSSGCSSTCSCSGSVSSQYHRHRVESCASLYSAAMDEYLQSMLGNYEFYVDWMLVETPDGEYIPNYALIDALIRLIDEFLGYGFDLSFSKKSCWCGKKDTSASDTNIEIIKKYRTLLGWVRNVEIECNTNKIKVNGSAFGKLLPKLSF